MNNHTPGPWTAGLTNSRKVPAFVVGATSACGFTPLVCHVQSADIEIGNANARLVAAAERESCAQVCEAERGRLFWVHNVQAISADNLVAAIRARGEK